MYEGSGCFETQCSTQFVCVLLGERVVQGLYDYAAAEIGIPSQDLNFKQGDYMIVTGEYVCMKDNVRLQMDRRVKVGTTLNVFVI